jgi:hypothetical protein
MLAVKSAFRFWICTFILMNAIVARGDDGSGTDAFCDRARTEFDQLLRLSRNERRAYWQQRYGETIDKFSAKSKELNLTAEMIAKEPDAEKLKGVFAFDYLNEMRELELDETTKLVEDLGHEILQDRISVRLTPALTEADAQFTTLKGKAQTDNLQRAYTALLDLKRRAAQIDSAAPAKETFDFEPMANAYASEPIKKKVYVIHDWNAALAKVDDLAQQLGPIQDSVEAARFFSPKDPSPWITIFAQIVFLAVAIPGWIKSYHEKVPLRTVAVLVVVSIFASVFLIFYSKETIWNVLRQALVPSGFILYWVARKKGWIRGRKSSSAPAKPAANEISDEASQRNPPPTSIP